jgi:hypothetical protein
MRHVLLAASLSLFTINLVAQPTGGSLKQKPAITAEAAAPAAIKDLPVRKVVLYKNGVGYFEHSGTVSGNQRVAIDFTSPQLNDVLQTLTVLDEGGGRIAGVNYNSTTPLAEQLKSLSLGMGDDPNATELFQALRGQRVEVTGAPGGLITGRLMAIETRTEKFGGASAGSDGDSSSAATIEKFYLTLVAGSGAVRVIELTPQLSVRPLDADLQSQLDRYLELLSTTHANGLRHLTLNALGQGQRQLRVSYISEVPVWKSTYRMVFPREANGKAIVQGWAVVDNTVGADWDNVQLSLVAGAPQSFIQPLSQPLYTRRPEVPIATDAQLTPQTHEAAESRQMDKAELSATPYAPAPLSVNQSVMVNSEKIASTGRGSGGGLGTGSGIGYGPVNGGSFGKLNGVYRATDAIGEGDVATNAFDDFFQYALTQPVTIHKNESAMVPILQQELPAEHVTLWSQREATPLRAVWLENNSKLTLDTGSFSIFENGEFAGEGLLDPIHPGEKRLLSYAADQAIRVRITDSTNKRALSHLEIRKGVIIETHMDVASQTYTAVNSAEEPREVLLEHPRRTNGWSLDDGLKADETAPSLYRFKVPVAAHSTAKLEVREHGPEQMRVDLNPNQNQTVYLLDLVKRVPDALSTLQPVIDAQTAVAKLDWNIAQSKKNEEMSAADEARDRENVTALKGNDAAKRFVDDLNRAEDALQAARKQTADLTKQKEAAVAKLNEAIAALSFDWSVRAEK